MNDMLNADTLHRTAKYFMDSGAAASHEKAMAILGRFALAVHVGADIAASAAKQVALLSLVNLGHRTLLGGVRVIGVPECTNLTTLSSAPTLRLAIETLGGICSDVADSVTPVAVIGDGEAPLNIVTGWRLTWNGWCGGVAPLRDQLRLADDENMALAPMVAAACLMTEVFSYHAGDHPMAGRRAAGLSLWRPDVDWREQSTDEPALGYLPSRLWLIGLGNLGQAFCWTLAALPYADPAEVELVLQDFDTLAASNASTSLLTFPRNVGKKKARITAAWLEAQGFKTTIEERRFGPAIKRENSEPGVALCGVDNALARSALEDADFDFVVEAGLGAGPDGFRGISVHTFPGSRTARSIWSNVAVAAVSVAHMPAYEELAKSGMDECGLAILASRTVGVPFVGLLAATLAISELLRRLHGGATFELISTSSNTLDDVTTIAAEVTTPYSFGHLAART
ncbi:hypothetical protein P9272_03540 [Mesorhizobium sp. WSM4976]|uniref:hypothetical protein n=1 Tax=Mesorhizobium sp. WSM4976 TaxID=3038549 RepID=UPI002416AF9D|nr:hypothetical protein [Mesorhizobium sp. WSM4976]MDG4892663.1 hypothetical protein [Mesorhizobium sp. WSM4976]